MKATPELIEQLAAIEHERWSDWQRYMFSRCQLHPDAPDGVTLRTLIIPGDLVERWWRQIDTPYAELSEAEKESDREQVRRYLHLITEA